MAIAMTITTVEKTTTTTTTTGDDDDNNNKHKQLVLELSHKDETICVLSVVPVLDCSKNIKEESRDMDSCSTRFKDENDFYDDLRDNSSPSSSLLWPPQSPTLTLASSTFVGSGHTFDDIPDNSLHTCLELLCSHDLDQNRVGLQRLMLLTKGRALSGLHRSEIFAAFVLVYGGQYGSIEDRLRYAFATMICDEPHDEYRMANRNDLIPARDDVLMNNSNIYFQQEQHEFTLDNTKDRIQQYETNDVSSDYDSDSSYFNDDSTSDDDIEEDFDTSQGKAFGALHNHGLRVLSNALSQILLSSYAMDKSSHRRIPFHDTIWRNITQSLVHNIETNHNADSTGYSLKILRLLYTMQPKMVQPLLQQTVFPHLAFLKEYGHERLFPMIHNEASYLLKQIT